MGGIFDMRVWISGDRNRRKPLSLKGQDTIQGASLLHGGRDVSHAEILPSFRRGGNLVTLYKIRIFQET